MRDKNDSTAKLPYLNRNKCYRGFLDTKFITSSL